MLYMFPSTCWGLLFVVVVLDSLALSLFISLEQIANRVTEVLCAAACAVVPDPHLVNPPGSPAAAQSRAVCTWRWLPTSSTCVFLLEGFLLSQDG